MGCEGRNQRADEAMTDWTYSGDGGNITISKADGESATIKFTWGLISDTVPCPASALESLADWVEHNYPEMTNNESD